MVFQFEHVGLDHGPRGKWDLRPLRLPDLKASLGRWQAGLAERGWNCLYWDNHDQPRVGVPVRRRRPEHRVGLGQDARHRAAPAPRHAVRLPGRRARHDQRPVRRDRRLPRHRVAQLLRRGGRAATPTCPSCCWPRCGQMSRDNARTPMQWDASPQRRLHHRHAVDRGQPEPRRDQRGRRGRRPRLGVPPLPAADRAAARRPGRRRRRLPAAAARPPVDLGVPAPHRRRRTAGRRQLLRRRISIDLPLDAGWAAAAAVLTSHSGDPLRPPPALKLQPWESVVWRRARSLKSPTASFITACGILCRNNMAGWHL